MACNESSVEDVPEGQVLESGWEELGMDDQWAARVATDMADDDNPALPIDFYKVSYAPFTCRLQTKLDLRVGCVSCSHIEMSVKDVVLKYIEDTAPRELNSLIHKDMTAGCTITN